MSLRPRTTALLPDRGTPVDSKSRITAEGVQGAKRGTLAREDRCPILYAWNLELYQRMPDETAAPSPIHILFWTYGLSYKALAI